MKKIKFEEFETLFKPIEFYMEERDNVEKGIDKIFPSSYVSVELGGNLLDCYIDLLEKYLNIDRNDWGVSTNLQSSFDLILKTAVKASVPPEDMPEVLYIISDMEFDWACKDNTKTNFQVMREKYETAGYKLPRVVWWNVDARNSNYPIRADDTGTCLVSGCSPSILKTVMSSKIMDPISIMLSTVNIPRYERIAV